MTELGDQILATLHHIAPDVEPGSVDRDRPLADQLDLDSMDYQSLLTALATQHGVQFRDADIPRLRSVRDLVDYIQASKA